MLCSLEEAIRQMQVGKRVILLDADHREGEADFAIAAQLCAPERINFLLSRGRGMVCLSLPLAVAAVSASSPWWSTVSPLRTEILNADGEIATRDELFAIGKEPAIPVLHIDTLLERQRLQGTA